MEYTMMNIRLTSDPHLGLHTPLILRPVVYNPVRSSVRGLSTTTNKAKKGQKKGQKKDTHFVTAQNLQVNFVVDSTQPCKFRGRHSQNEHFYLRKMSSYPIFSS